MAKKILVINPGSTSTKIAVFTDTVKEFEKTIRYKPEELSKYDTITDQYPLRSESILELLKENNLAISTLDAVVGRGGLLKPIPGGTYLVNEQMVQDAKIGLQGQHASNLGCILAYEIAKAAKVKAYIVDPVCCDELEPLARLSGHPDIERKSLAHTLNIHAVGRRASQKLGLNYFNCNLLIAHLGGGISIAPLKKGRIIDINDASNGGPYSPERTGTLPIASFLKWVFASNKKEKDLKKEIMGKGGLYAYLGTTDCLEIEARIKNGDQQAAYILEGMAYQIAKEIGAMATVLKGKVDSIILTGGIAHLERLCNWISERVNFIAEVIVLPGEFELEALAEGTLRVLNKEEEALSY